MDYDAAILPRPRFDLDLIPIQHEGRELILVRDPLQLVKAGSAVDPALIPLLQLLEQGITMAQFQQALTESQGGVLVPRDECERLLAALDSASLLDTPAYREKRRLLEEEYAALAVRAPSHAGVSYPAETDAAADLVDAIIAAGKAALPAGETPEGPLLAIVAPHIDIAVGRSAYGHAFAALAETLESDAAAGRRPIDRVVILGVGHKLTDSLYSVTTKDYETPLGRLRTDADAVARLAALGPPIVSASDWVHRDEHSAEFPALFLQRLFPDPERLAIVPVLCGSAHIDPDEYSRAMYTAHAAKFMEALSDIVADESRRTLVLASVDFSHIGPKFGHGQTAHALESETSSHDRALLEGLAAGSAEAFWEESVRVQDRYNVCGFSAMSTMLEALPPMRGQVLDYAMHHEEPTRSAVSFAAMRLHAV